MIPKHRTTAKNNDAKSVAIGLEQERVRLLLVDLAHGFTVTVPEIELLPWTCQARGRRLRFHSSRRIRRRPLMPTNVGPPGSTRSPAHHSNLQTPALQRSVFLRVTASLCLLPLIRTLKGSINRSLNPITIPNTPIRSPSTPAISSSRCPWPPHHQRTIGACGKRRKLRSWRIIAERRTK